MRLFVSILVPEEIRVELVRIQKELRAAEFFDGTYVKPENFHSTVYFFGSVEDNLLPLIGAQLGALHVPSCTVSLKEVGVNSASHPHVLWVSLDSPGLALLAQAVSDAFPSYRQERTFNGHITLARIKQVNKAAMKTALSRIAVQPLVWEAHEYALQVSQTLPEGPVYTTIGIYRLEKK